MKSIKIFGTAALSLCLLLGTSCGSMTNTGKGALIGGGGGAGAGALIGGLIGGGKGAAIGALAMALTMFLQTCSSSSATIILVSLWSVQNLGSVSCTDFS